MVSNDMHDSGPQNPDDDARVLRVRNRRHHHLVKAWHGRRLMPLRLRPPALVPRLPLQHQQRPLCLLRIH